MSQHGNVKRNSKSQSKTKHHPKAELDLKPEDLGVPWNQVTLHKIMILAVKTGIMEGSTLRSMAVEVSSRTRYDPTYGQGAKVGGQKTEKKKEEEQVKDQPTANSQKQGPVDSLPVSGFKKFIKHLAGTREAFEGMENIDDTIAKIHKTQELQQYMFTAEPTEDSLLYNLRAWTVQAGITDTDGTPIVAADRLRGEILPCEPDEGELKASRIWFPRFGRKKKPDAGGSEKGKQPLK
jgi:hypothetical protein